MLVYEVSQTLLLEAFMTHCFPSNTQLQVSVFFDIIFIIQHYVLYAGNKSSKSEITTEHEDQIREQLVRPSDLSPPDNA